MRQQNSVDGREVFNGNARTPEATQNNEPVGENGIDQQIHAADLNQKRGVTDKGHSDISIFCEDWLVLLTLHWMKRGAGDQSKNETEIWAACHQKLLQ